MEQNPIKQRFKELKKNRDTSIQKAVETPKGRTDVPVPNSPLRSTAFFSTEAPQPSETTQFGFTGNGVDLSVPATEKPIKFPQHVELKNGKSWGQFNPYALAEGREPFGYESSRKDDYLKMINSPSPLQEQAPRSYFGVSNKDLKANASAEAKAELRRRNQMNVAVSRISSMSAIDKNRLMNAISAGYDTIDELDGAKRQYDLNREKELKEIERRANRTREEIADEFFSTQSEVYKLDRLNALNETLTARWDELEKVRKSEISQNASKGGGMHALAGAMSSSIDNSNKKDSYSRYLGYTLNRIRQSLNIATQASQLHKREKDGFFTNLAEGFVDNVTDPYKMLPFVQGGDEKLFSNLIDKYNKNEKLTKEESELLDAVAFANYIEGELSQTLGKDYVAGDITAQALPFIAEIAIASYSGGTGAGAVGQRIGRAIGKKGLNKLTERGIVYTSGKLTRWGTKLAGATGRVAGDAVTSLGMTVTTGAGYTYNDMMRRLNTSIELNEDRTKAGNVIQSKETPLSAGLKAVGAGTIERFSEFAGGYIPAVGKFLPKSLTARVGASKVGRYISRTMNYAPVQTARKAVQLQGFGGEFAEELLGGTLNSLIVGDETLEQVYSTDNLQQIGVGLLPLQVAFGGASSVGYTANNIRLRKNVKKNAETLKSVGVDVDALNARLATMNYDEQARAMNSALASAHSAYRSMKKQGGSEKEAILDENLAKLSAEANYIFSYMSYQAHKGASVDVQLEAVQRVQSKADESAKEAMSLDATLNKEHQNYTSVAYRGKTYTVAGGTYNAIPRLKEDGTQETSKSGSYIYDVESDETIYIRDEESGEVIPVPSNEVQALDATMTKEEVKAFYRDRALQLLGEQEEVSGEQILDKNRLQKGSIVEVENEDGTISLAQVIHDSGDAVSVVRENSVHVDVVPRVTVSSEQEEVEEGQAKDGTTIVPEESRNYEVEAGDDVQFEENGTVHRGRVMSVDADVVWVQKDGDAVHVAIPRNEQKVWYAPVHAEEHVEQLDAGKVQEEQPVEESTQLENRFANKPTGVLRSYLSQQKKALEQAKSTLEKMENGEEGAFGDKALSMDEMEFALQQQRELVATLEEEVAELEAELQSRESAEKIEEQPEEQVETPTTKEEVEQEQQEPISQEQQDETGEDGLQEEEPESFDSVKEEKPENQEPARQPNPSPHKNEDGYYGYLDGKTPMQKGRIQKALDKRFDFDGKVLSAYEFIVSAFERGDLSTSVSKYSTERKVKLEKVSKEHTSYEIITAGISYELGKTAYNFAKYLSNKIGEEQKDTHATKENEHNKEIVSSLVEQLEKSGLAKSVVVDKEAFDKKLEELDGKRLHTVYHGSPHSFEAFDHSKMGSGEGAQAFGWGTYVTEVEGIARKYAKNVFALNKKRPEGYNEAIERKRELEDKVWEKDRKRGEAKYWYEKFLEEKDGLERILRDPSHDPFGKPNLFFADFNFGQSFFSAEESLEERVKKIEDRLRVINEYILPEKKKALDEARKVVKDAEKELEEAKKEVERLAPKRHLYTVEVPDVTTNKYLVYNGIYDKERLVSLLDDIESRLQAFGVNTTEEVRGQASFSDWRKRVFEEGNDWETGVLSGKEIYEKLSNTLQGDKEASMFLSSLGFVGISYPAQYTTGGRADGARNFVIFKEEDAKITEHVQFLKGGGTVYGFVVDGVVYLNPSVLNTNTPIHEFAHLWNSLIQKIKPELYAEGTKLVKDGEYWEEVNRNPHYAGLSEAERVDEALAMAIGDFGAKKVKKYGIKGASFRAWLNNVWRSVKEFLGIKSQYKSIADFANRSLEDLLGGTKIGQAQGVSGFQTTKSGLTPEMEEIKTKAQSDGSFMKAPNGKPTNLNERQWLQVRTQAFKNWFGDWEKASRVEKLRQSSIVSISGKEIEPSEDIKQYKKNALEYGKRLQGSYVNKDTGKTISLQRGRKRGGINEVLQHDYKDAEHLQSISAIPRIIENAIYIDSLANLDDKLDADTFDYYVVGIQIGGVDYTVRAVVVNTKNGETYYDHKLSKIEKGKLLDLIESQGANISDFGTTPDSKSTITDFSGVKDIKLVSLLQTNSSKVVDENGEPLVVYHGTGAKFNAFSTKKTATPMFYFTSERHKIEEGVVGAKSSGRIVEAYLNMRKPAGWSEDDRLTTDQIKHKGYDGKALLDDRYNVYVAFYPNQIKSATDNVGTFDGENADIRFQRGLFDDVDTPYFDAIERGDMETAQRLVDERAEAMGYTRQEDYKDAHFAPVANVEKEDFDNIDVLREEVEENGIDTNLFAVAQGVHSQPDDYFSPKGARYYGYNDNDGMESYTALSNVIRSIQYQIKENGEVSDMPYITVYRAVPNYIDGAFLESEGQWVSPSKSYVESHGASRFGDGEYKVIEQEVPATHLWWDGNDIREWGFDDGNIYRYKNTKNNLKMNDAIVRDENGEIIPLSKRFDENNPNVLYRRTEAEKTANERFNKQLEAFEKGVLNTPLNFGPPSGWLKLLSLPFDGEMKMSLKDLQGHLKKHSLSVGDIRDLPMFLSEPLLVYEWGTKSPSLVIITSMPRGEERITVALRISRKGKNMEVNEIASIHSKNAGRFLQDMIMAKEGGLQQALRLVPNKQKALNWLGLVPPKGTASQANQELSSIAKIIEDFENPKLKDGGTSDALTSRTHEQRMSDNKTAYDKLFDRAGVEQVVDGVVSSLSVPVKARVVSRNDLKGRAKKSKGFYNSKTGEVSIVLENARSENDITQTILHEVVGHKGLDALFDKKNRDALFDSVASSMPEESREFLRTFYPNVSERELGAEYIAHLAEHYVEPSFIRKMASYVRSLLRSVGFNVKYSDGDIMTLLHRGVVALRKQSATSDEVLAYQIQEERVRKNMEYFDELEGTNDKELFFRATEDEREQVLSIADKFHKQGNGERLKEVWYDATSSIKKFQDEVEKASGKKIPDYINIHKIFNQTTSKASNLEQRIVEKWEDIAKRSRKLKRDIGLNDEQFKLYIFAQHAPERNELMRKNAVDEYLMQCKENGWVPDSKVLFEKENGDYASQRELEKSIKASFSAQSNSSIIGFETCQDLTSAISAIGGDEVTELWQEINALNKWILRTWYDGGLMSKSAFEKVSAMYKFYVPMQGFQEETASDVWEYYNKPKGVSSIIKTAKGRKSIAEDPFIIIRRNISSAVSLSAKNKEKQAVYNLVQAFKNDYVTIGSVWYVRKGEKWEASYPKDGSPEAIAEHEKEMDRLKENGDASLFSNQNKPNLGIKIDKTNAKEHVISVRFNGEERRLYVNGNPTLAHAINRTNVPELGGLLKAIKWVTQSMAANVTGRSLDFLTANVVRDLIWSRNAWVRWGWSAKDFIPNYLRSWGYIIGLNKSDETETLWKEFSENGGITGYSASISERKAKKITKYQFSNSAKSNLKRGLNRAFGAFVQFNEKAEQSARFGAYITARQKGESIISSIDKAKEITVNFSRHGSGNSLLYKAFAPFYMFMNANVQGVGVYFGMAIRNPIRFGIMMIAVPMMGRSVLEAVMSLAGGDDEEYQYINEFVRKSNVCVPLGDGKFVKIPLAPADRAWWGLADSFFSFTKGKKDATQFALSFVDASIDVASFVPILGGANIGEAVSDYRAGQSADLYPAWRGVVPDPAKPFTDLLFNRNFTGGKIDKTNSFNQHLPNYKRVGDNVPEFMVGVSEWLNKAMVGKYLGEAEKSPIDFLNNPTAVQYLVYSYFGGIAKTVDQVANVADSSIDGKPVGETLSVAPVVNRFYKQDPRLKEKYEAREFYTERETIKKLNKSVGALEKMWEKASTEEEGDGIERDVKKKLGKMDYETYLQKKHFFDECDRVLKVARDNLNVATGTERDVAQKELDSIIQEALEIHSTIK